MKQSSVTLVCLDALCSGDELSEKLAELLFLKTRRWYNLFYLSSTVIDSSADRRLAGETLGGPSGFSEQETLLLSLSGTLMSCPSP